MFINNTSIDPIELVDLGITVEAGINDLSTEDIDDVKNSDDLKALIKNDTLIVVDYNHVPIPKEVVIRNFSTGHAHSWNDLEDKPTEFKAIDHQHTHHPTHEEMDNKIQAIVDSAPEALDTLNEIAIRLSGDQDAIDSITSELALKSVQGHDHNNDYHTKSEANTLLDGKSNNVHTHDDTYKKPEIDLKLDDKSCISHGHNLADLTEKEYSSLVNTPIDDNFAELTLSTTLHDNDYLPIFCLSQNQYRKVKKSDLVASQSGDQLQSFYAQYRTEEDGGTMTAGGWRTRPLNTVVNNNILGMRLDKDTMYIPEGTYWITAEVMGFRLHGNSLGVSDASNLDQPLIIGMTNYDRYGINARSTCSGIIIIGEETKLQLVQFSERSVNRYGMGLNPRDFNNKTGYNIFAGIQVWRIG